MVGTAEQIQKSSKINALTRYLFHNISSNKDIVMNKLPINNDVISVFTKEIVPFILEEYKKVVKILNKIIDCIEIGEYKRPDLIINIDLPIFIANNKERIEFIKRYTGNIDQINRYVDKLYLKYNENQVLLIAVYDGIVVIAGKGEIEQEIVKFNSYLDEIRFDLIIDTDRYIRLLKSFIFIDETSKYYGRMYKAIFIWGDYKKVDSLFEEKKSLLPVIEKKYLENIQITLKNDCLNKLIKVE